MTETVVFGVAAAYAWEVFETLRRLDVDFACVDNMGELDPTLPGLHGELKAHRGNVVLGPGLPRARAATCAAAFADGVRRMDAVVDPSAVVAATAGISHGVYVNALACVGAKATLGCMVNINRTASVAHHCEVGAFTATGPGAVLCGAARTGTGVFVGAGAVVLPGRSVGDWSVVGAGAIVTKDVPEGVIVMGNPARVAGEAPPWETGSKCPLC